MANRSVKTKYSKLASYVIFACLVLVLAICAVKCKSLWEQRTELEAQAAELELQIADAQDVYAELQEKEEYMQTKKYVEEVARNQLGLVYPDEIVIRPED